MRPQTATASGLPAGHRLVPRSALFGPLSAAGPGSVLLVCAPAGSGKTELLRSWADAEGLGHRVAWVSVERGEQDAQHFWLSVIDALTRVAGEEWLVEPFGATPAFRGDGVIRRLLSDLPSLEEPLVLVIDDLHELRSADALRLLELFLSELPPQLRVALATREEPELGLHRLRLSGRLTEIRGPDLRFSLEETRRLLEADGIKLSDDGVALLHERTEGWAAGLRLAALSLAKHPEPERFVTEFSGSERTVAGYLMAEVLERQPAEVRELLLRTSVLERVSGPLADFLTGSTGSERILQQLEEANAFVVSLDAGRTWFRYHHLFAELLRLELRRTSPALVGVLHRAAAQWYEQHGSMVEAIRHAQAAADWPLAARLLADSYVSLVLDGRVATLSGLVAAFPDGDAGMDPELALAFAAGRLFEGLLEETATYLAVAERLADMVPAERRRRFDAERAEITLALARRRGNVGAAIETMRSMEELLAAPSAGELALSNDLRAAALMNLGIAELWSSHLDDARRHLQQALELAQTDRAAAPGDRLPRAPGDGGAARRAARLGGVRALRAGGDHRPGARLDGGPGQRPGPGDAGDDAGLARAIRRGRAGARAGTPRAAARGRARHRADRPPVRGAAGDGTPPVRRGVRRLRRGRAHADTAGRRARAHHGTAQPHGGDARLDGRRSRGARGARTPRRPRSTTWRA